jgi:hypothetical protein
MITTIIQIILAIPKIIDAVSSVIAYFNQMQKDLQKQQEVKKEEALITAVMSQKASDPEVDREKSISDIANNSF